MTHVHLLHLDGRPWMSTGFLAPSQVSTAWSWVAESIARECECDEDDVDCTELDDGREVVTVHGEPVAEYRIGPSPTVATAPRMAKAALA